MASLGRPQGQRLGRKQSFAGPFTGAISSFRRALVRSGVELRKRQASYALRHTFASHFMQNGGSILTLQKI